VQFSAPKELFKLTEAVEVLMERALAEEHMLEGCAVPREAAGWPFDEASWKFSAADMDDNLESRENMKLALIEALDTDRPLLEVLPLERPALHRIEVVAEILLLFLRALTDGIITAPLWARLETALPGLGTAARASTPEAREDDKAAVLDVLSAAPNHNIAFVFLTAMLARLAAELSPVTRADLDALAASRRPALAFRRSVGAAAAAAEVAVTRRRARERRLADMFGKIVCRTAMPAREKERKAVQERQRGVVELFLRREADG
jgi:hypothetical protein